MDTGLPKDTLQAGAVHCLKELGVEATKAEELTTDMPEVLRNAIQTGINNANKKAVSNAARVCLIFIFLFSCFSSVWDWYFLQFEEP